MSPISHYHNFTMFEKLEHWIKVTMTNIFFQISAKILCDESNICELKCE